MTILLKKKVEKILAGNGVAKDLDDIKDWSKKMKANRCGLGHTAANPILTSLNNFRYLYEGMINRVKDYDSGFDLMRRRISSSKCIKKRSGSRACGEWYRGSFAAWIRKEERSC